MTSATPDIDDEGKREDERHRAFKRLFPGARVTRPLTTSPHPVGVVAARSWFRISLALLLAGLAVIGEILLLSGPTSLLGFGWTPLVLGVAGTAAGAFGLAWSRYELRPRTAAERTAWESWAHERGLTSVNPGMFTPRPRVEGRATRSYPAVGDANLHVQPSRSYSPTYRTLLGGTRDGIVAYVGTVFIRGPWGVVTNSGFGCLAVLIKLPEGAEQRLPASTLDRFVRGERPWSGRSGAKMRQLRLESQDFDDACDLRVEAGSDDLEWYRLLDPEMLAGLARDWPVSWQQLGRTLVVYVPAPALRLDAVQLDTLCAAAEAIGRHFRDAATTSAPISDEVRERRELQRATHRRRRIAQNVASWLAVLAVLSVPIYIVTTLDARRDDARNAEIRERNERFQRSYRLETDRADTIYAVREVVRAVSACPDQCTELDAAARREILANDAISGEQLDAVRIERDGATTRVSSTTEAGVTFALEWRGEIPETGTYSCAPVGETCTGGTWGGADG